MTEQQITQSVEPNQHDRALAQRMVQAAVWMKPQYQDAGLVVARVFCDAKGFDADALEREVRTADLHAGGHDGGR